MSFVEFVTGMKVETLIACRQHAFDAFGGFTQRILYDNMKTVVIERDATGEGEHCFHAGFLDYARHCGFVIKLCRPYRAKTKGKVERFNGYLRRSFYVPLAAQLKQAGLGFIERQENVVLIGPLGVGKTHLAMALAYRAAQAGIKRWFTSAVDLLLTLTAHTQNQLKGVMHRAINSYRLLDRLLHHVRIVPIAGERHRFKNQHAAGMVKRKRNAAPAA